jgi:hypothetical protein
MTGFAIRAKNPNFSVKYMAYVEGDGDTEVFKDGELCGSNGSTGQIEGMKVWVTNNN